MIISHFDLRTNLDEEEDSNEVIPSAEPGQEGKTKDIMHGLVLSDYFDCAFQSEPEEPHKYQAHKMKDKVSVKDDQQLKIMKACVFFSRTIKPIIILIFVFIYWGSGLYRTYQIE